MSSMGAGEVVGDADREQLGRSMGTGESVGVTGGEGERLPQEERKHNWVIQREAERNDE